MKKILFVALCSLVVAACDQIDEDNRYIEVPATVERAVLLEEFTGQMCSNCPEAHEEVAKLKAQYGDSLISVSIHALETALTPERASAMKTISLKTPEGDTYAAYHEVKANPMGIVNRTSGALMKDDWAAAISLAARIAPKVNLQATASIKDGEIEVKATTNAKKGNLQLWVVEDGITAYQLNVSSPRTYVHNHVYRASINGVGGTAVAPTSVHKIALNEAWNVANLSVVAFVYDAAGVQRVVQVHL